MVVSTFPIKQDGDGFGRVYTETSVYEPNRWNVKMLSLQLDSCHACTMATGD